MSMNVPGSGPIASLRITATALVTAPLVILLAVSFVLPTDDGGFAPVWAWAAVGFAAGAAATVVSTLGFRTVAIAPGTPEDEARQTSLAALTSTTMLRCVLTEGVAIVGLAIAFVVPEGGLLLYVVAAVTSVVLSVALSWPSDRIIARVRDSLEREGGTSYL